jgi:hypothetical protein
MLETRYRMRDAIFQMPDSSGGEREDKERETETRREGTVEGRIGNAEGGMIRLRISDCGGKHLNT